MRRGLYNIGNPHSDAGEIGVLDSLAVNAGRELDISCPPQAIRRSSLVVGIAGAFGSSFPQLSWLVVVGTARALGSSSP